MTDTTTALLSKYDIENLQLTLKQVDKTLESAEQDAGQIRDWMKTQPHLPEIMENEYIHKFLFLNKYSIEVSKKKIDMYYTIRSLMPDIFDEANPKLPHMQKVMDYVNIGVLPKLTNDYCRVIIYKLGANAKLEDVESRFYLAHSLNLCEILLKDNWCLDFVFVLDMEGVTADVLKLFSFSLLGKAVTIFEKVYSLHGKKLYLINSPTFVSTILNFLKTLLKPKMFERIKVYGNINLGELIETEILPKDYGGKEVSLYELNESLRRKMLEYQDRFDKLDKMRVNESLRPEKLENDDFLGYHGNFKKISVD